MKLAYTLANSSDSIVAYIDKLLLGALQNECDFADVKADENESETAYRD